MLRIYIGCLRLQSASPNPDGLADDHTFVAEEHAATATAENGRGGEGQHYRESAPEPL